MADQARCPGISSSTCGTGILPVETIAGDQPKGGTPSRARRRAIRAALLRKEWLEQRWRFFLGTLVLSGLLASLLRAQIIPANEAALLIYWPVGIFMVIFLAMGPVAAEKADRTWGFLIAQPISRADVLIAKWRMGLVQLIGMMAIATAAGALALWSRGFREVPADLALRLYGPLPETVDGLPGWLPGYTHRWAAALEISRLLHPVGALFAAAFFSTAALACIYTPLFFILSRARNEFSAALGGILLVLATHVWLVQLAAVGIAENPLFLYSGLLNPLAPLPLMWFPPAAVFLPLMAVVHVLLWIVLPIVIVRRIARKAVTR